MKGEDTRQIGVEFKIATIKTRAFDKRRRRGKVGGMGIGILWKGITLGLGAAAPIGPVNVEIARRAIRGGFWAGFLLGLGAVTVDVSYVILASLSVKLFLDYPRVMLGMGVAGGPGGRARRRGGLWALG